MNQLLINTINIAINDLRYAIVDYLDSNSGAFRSPDDDSPDLDNDLDLDGRVGEIVDLAIPIDISKFKRYAPENANTTNIRVAVYAVIYAGVEGWYDEHGWDVCDNWLKNRQ